MIDILLDLSMNAKINNTDQILVKYFLNQREKLIELSLEDVIYDTGLSKSSIIRFCKSIKTSHFTDFKKTFVREFNAVICDFIYLLDDRDKLDDLVIACNHCHQIILFGEREAMLIWKMYLKYFYVLGYDIYIINEEDNNLAINMDEHTLYFYSHLQISLEKYYDYNISNALDVYKRQAVMYAQDKGYHVQLPIRGIIRGRGYEGDHFKRYLEIQIPIIKNSQIA